MNMDAGLYSLKKDPLPSVLQFFLGPVSNMRWQMDDEEEKIMDVGCGPGCLSTRSILRLFPKARRIIAVDVQPGMIENAMANSPYPYVQYSVADIEEWSSVEKWENQISKLFSIHVFQWLKDQRRSFENVWRLLKPGGYGVFFFCLQSTFFDMCLDLKKDLRWTEYLKDVDAFVAPSHTEQYEPKYYTDMLTEIGFSIEYCNCEVKEDAFPSDATFKDFFSSICVVLQHIPKERRDEFKNCIFDYLIQKNGRVNGLPVHRGRMMEVIVKKI